MVRDPNFPVFESSRGDKTNSGEMSNHKIKQCDIGALILMPDSPIWTRGVTLDKAEEALRIGRIRLFRGGGEGLPGREGKMRQQ